MAIVKKPDPKELFKEVAMDIGKQVVHHIETMYPAAIEATSSTFKLSVRNCVYNEIMLAMNTKNWVDFIERMDYRKGFRRWQKAVLKSARSSQFSSTATQPSGK